MRKCKQVVDRLFELNVTPIEETSHEFLSELYDY